MFVLMKIFSNPFCFVIETNGGVGDRRFGKSYRIGDRVYSCMGISASLTAEPCGNTGGQTSLYIMEKSDNE